MAKSQEIVLAYQQALGRKDFQAARKLLHDDSEFRGPFDTFHRADDYLHAIQELSAIVEDVDILRVFEDANDVSLFCDVKTKTVGTSLVTEWYKANEGKIVSVRAAFDPPLCGHVQQRGRIPSADRIGRRVALHRSHASVVWHAVVARGDWQSSPPDAS